MTRLSNCRFALAAIALTATTCAGAALQIDPGPSALGVTSFSMAAFEGVDANQGHHSGDFGGTGHSGSQSWSTPLGSHYHLAEGGQVLRSQSTWLMGRDDHINTGSIKARGGSIAYAKDQIRVTLPPDMGDAQQGSMLKFEWKLSGNLEAKINSYSGSALDTKFGFQWGYHSDVEAWFQYTDLSGGRRVSLLERDIQRTAGVPLTAEQRWAQAFLSDEQAFWSHVEAPAAFEWVADHKSVDTSNVSSTLVLAAPGSGVEVMFGLSTSYNMQFTLVDMGADMISKVESDFAHTMELVGVSLLNPDGSAYVGQWAVESAAGLDYREIIVNSPPVPEPGTWAMLLAGLAGLAWVAGPRRRAVAAPSRFR